MRSFACLLFVLPTLALSQETADPAKKLDELFDARTQPAADQEQEKFLAETIKAQPENFEVLWRGARWKAWQADAAGSDKQKAAIAKEGLVLADRARKLKPDSPLGHYWAASTVGLYAQGIGILNALGEGVEGKFNERLDRAIQLDPTIDHGGPWMLKGRYHYELPWPMRDLNKSRAMLEKTVGKFPQNLRAQFYLAETLHKDGKHAEAKAALARAKAGPGTHPAEAKRVWAMVKKVEAEIMRAR
ncbi:MAG: hypothetical protein M3Y59_08285 [Myxococcota bacterium]|nr:hypothetical protein [Myxococcota bacterium]